MKKLIIIFCVFALIFASCGTRRITAQSELDCGQIQMFPFERLTGYTDSMLIEKHKNDITGFQKLEQVVNIVTVSYGRNQKRIGKVYERRKNYPKEKINNIEEVAQWLKDVHGNSLCGRNCWFYTLSHYKQVDNGFLVKGRYWHHTDIIMCRITRFEIFFIGYDHNILSVRQWEKDLCPNLHINVEVILPEFQNAEIRYPKLPRTNNSPNVRIRYPELFTDDSIANYFIMNARFPLLAIENYIKGKVLVNFVVETDGTISNVEIASITNEQWFSFSMWQRTINIEINELFERTVMHTIMSTNGKWIPAMKNNEKIPIEVKVEFFFMLGNYY